MMQLLSQYEQKYGLPSGILNAVYNVESGGNQNAVSPKGAQGAFQFMPDTAKELGVDPFDPTSAADGAARYLKQNYDKFGNWDLALAAYNAGPGNVQKYGGVPPFKETQSYVQKVNSQMATPQPTIPAQPVAQTSDWRSRARPVQSSQEQGIVPVQPLQMPTTQASDWRSRAVQLAKPQEPGFIDRVKSDVSQRVGQMDKSAQAYVAGQQSMGETVAQQAMQGASVFPDVVGEAVSTVTPDFIKNIGSKLVTAAGNLPVPFSQDGNTLAEVLPKEASRVSEAAGPRVMRNATAVGQALNVVPVAKGVAAVGNLAAKGGKAVLGKQVVQDYLKSEGTRGAIPKAPPQMTAADLKTLAGQAYDEAAYLGATFKAPDVADKVVKEINALKPKPIAGSILTSEDKVLINNLNEFDALKGKTLTLDDIKRFDESLSNKITTSFVDKQTGLPDANGRKLLILQNKMRDIVDNVPDTPGNDALVNARSLWKAQRMMDDLDRVVERAGMTRNPDVSMQTGYRNLFMDKDRIRGWPEEAKTLLQKAGTTGFIDDALSPITSRLMAIGQASLGNFAGAATAQAIGMAGRGTKEALIARRGAKVQQAIVKDTLAKQRPVKITPPEPVPLEQRLLAAPDKMSRLPMSEAEIRASQKKISVKPSESISGGAISVKPSPDQVPPKLIPPKDKLSYLPLSTKEITQMQVKSKTPDVGQAISGSAIKTPVNRLTNLESSLSKTKLKELNKLGSMLKAGDLSQNAFVKEAKGKFNLTESKARQLAKELKAGQQVNITKPSKVSYTDAFGTQDQYVYHITDKRFNNLESFIKNGIKPSKDGYSGPGVYMANTPENTLYNVGSLDEGTLYRINKEKLIRKFGKYPENKTGVQFDDSTGEVILEGQRSVPPEFIEVKIGSDWAPITTLKKLRSDK